MGDKLMEDLLREYLSDDDLDDAKDMMNMSREEYLENKIHKIAIKNEPQYVKASVNIFKKASKSDRFAVCRYSIIGLTESDQKVCLRFIIDNSKVVEKTIIVSQKSMSEGIMHLTDELDEFIGREVSCFLSIRDSIDREVFSSMNYIQVFDLRPAVKINATMEVLDIHTGKASKYPVARFKLRSEEHDDQICTISVSNENGFNMSRDVTVVCGKEELITFEIDEVDLGFFVQSPVCIAVYSGNQIILRKDRIQYSVGSRCSDISVSKKKIAVECIGASIIDTKIRIGGKVVFGTIAFVNNDKSPENITWAVFVDGDKVEQNVLVLLPSMTVQKEITIAPHYLQKENTYDATIRVVVFDSGSSPLFDRSFVSTVMSKYDLNLRDLNKQTADLVNPHLEEIKRFVVSGDGQLAKAMGDNFMVCGYQDPKMVYPQLKALYNAVRDYGMSYVSDVITTESGYQRVRDPVTVLRDHSGNCIELSILFASMLESMGFRTIIVFPEGHAVVGVVMRIDGNALAKQLNIELENKVIDLRINGNMIGAVFFESTNCRDSSSRFEKAVDVATSIVSIQKRFIESNGRISISNSLQR